MSRKIKSDQLGNALSKELGLYHTDLVKRVNTLSEGAIKTLVKKTKATAPKRTGDYRKAIASKRLERTRGGDKWVWYVKAPYHRLTHLLVHGHATKTGGRTKANPFLRDAVGEVIPEYEAAVKEALQG